MRENWNEPNPKNPMFGSDWSEYYRGKYGINNVQHTTEFGENPYFGATREGFKYKELPNERIEVTYIDDNMTQDKWIMPNPKQTENTLNQLVNHTKPEQKIVGDIANELRNHGIEINGLGVKVSIFEPDGTMNDGGDMDILLDKYMIEVKHSAASLKVKQIHKYMNPNAENYFNPEGREIIFFVKGGYDSTTETGALLDEYDVKVFADIEDLLKFLEEG